jgi:hypothetical protein
MANKLITYLILSILFHDGLGSEQSVIVVGQLICNKQYLLNAEVEIWERDLCKFQLVDTYFVFLVDPDDFLNKTQNLEGGYFVLTGTENEFFSISPYIKITHRCDVVDERVSLCFVEANFIHIFRVAIA